MDPVLSLCWDRAVPLALILLVFYLLVFCTMAIRTAKLYTFLFSLSVWLCNWFIRNETFYNQLFFIYSFLFIYLFLLFISFNWLIFVSHVVLARTNRSFRPTFIPNIQDFLNLLVLRASFGRLTAAGCYSFRERVRDCVLKWPGALQAACLVRNGVTVFGANVSGHVIQHVHYWKWMWHLAS